MGSESDCLFGQLDRILWISDSEAGVKVEKTGGVAGGEGRCGRVVVGLLARLVSWSLTSLFSTNTAISETMSADGQGTKCRRNIAENLNRLIGCTSVTDRQTDRQTDDRRTGDSI